MTKPKPEPADEKKLVAAAKRAQAKLDRANAAAEATRLERDAALAQALDAGVSASVLSRTTGMTRQWVYRAANDHRKATALAEAEALGW